MKPSFISALDRITCNLWVVGMPVGKPNQLSWNHWGENAAKTVAGFDYPEQEA
jgi:hypothetical protein